MSYCPEICPSLSHLDGDGLLGYNTERLLGGLWLDNVCPEGAEYSPCTLIASFFPPFRFLKRTGAS